MSNELSHVHVTHEAVSSLELTPAHAPRVETETYRKAHHTLIYELDKPCIICGVRNSTLHDPTENRLHATCMETHHFPIERSLVNACDWRKVHQQFPQVIDEASLEAFVDSPANLYVLCDVHHISVEYGIHHLLPQDFYIQPFLRDGYHVVAPAAAVAVDTAQDEQIDDEPLAA